MPVPAGAIKWKCSGCGYSRVEYMHSDVIFSVACPKCKVSLIPTPANPVESVIAKARVVLMNRKRFP